MELNYLKYFTEIAKTGSFNKAAENLYMGQPNLSRAVKELEAQLGVAVFTRSSKGVKLTREGEEFLRYAQSILNQVDELEAIYKNKMTVKQQFSISVPRASYISEAFVRFSRRINTVVPSELFYKETNSQRAVKNILESDYKLGIIRYADEYDKQYKAMLTEKGLSYEIITEFCYVLLMSGKHALASEERIVYSDLTPYTEIAHADPYVPSLPLSTVIEKELPDDIQKRIFVFERGSQLQLLAENTDTFMWVSPMPRSILDIYGLVQKKCESNSRIYKDVLIYRKNYALTETDKLFINELYSIKDELFNVKKQQNL